MCERPNNSIYKFEGYAENVIGNHMDKVSLNADY